MPCVIYKKLGMLPILSYGPRKNNFTFSHLVFGFLTLACQGQAIFADDRSWIVYSRYTDKNKNKFTLWEDKMNFCTLAKFKILLLVIFLILALIFTGEPHFFYIPGIQEAQAITVGTPSTNACDCNQLTISSHSISGTNALVLVGVSLDSGESSKTVNSITYNGINLTQLAVAFSASSSGSGSGNDDSKYAEMWYLVPLLNPAAGNVNMMDFDVISVSDDSSDSSDSSDSGGSYNYAEIWYLDPTLNPADGSYNVVVTIVGSEENKIAVGAITITGVNQTTPIDTGTVQSGSGEASQNTLAVTSESGDLIMDIIGTKANSITPDASQTELWDLRLGGGEDKYGGASTKAGAASVNMKYTFGESDKFAHIAFNINAADDDTTTTVFTPPPPPPPQFQGSIKLKPRNTR